jgi:small neutral amino acid transporter SnatA (MarC family)
LRSPLRGISNKYRTSLGVEATSASKQEDRRLLKLPLALPTINGVAFRETLLHWSKRGSTGGSQTQILCGRKLLNVQKNL